MYKTNSGDVTNSRGRESNNALFGRDLRLNSPCITKQG